MIQGLFIDFYGTLARQNGKISQQVVLDVCARSGGARPEAVYQYWWDCFCNYLQRANVGPFEKQLPLARQAFQDALAHFQVDLDTEELCQRMVTQWSHPDPYPETGAFLQQLHQLQLPYYIVTNGDSCFLELAFKDLGVKPLGVISSERASAYKPDSRIFTCALQQSGWQASQVVHIGDSWQNDVLAAQKVGIQALWLNRKPHGQIDNQVPASVPNQGIGSVVSPPQAPDLLAALAWVQQIA